MKISFFEDAAKVIKYGERNGCVFIVYVCLFIFFVIGCKRNSFIEQQLATAGNLSLDSAYYFLKSIRIEDISQPRAKANYALLYTEVCFKKMLPVTSDSLIDIALSYYQTKEEPAKLAKAYYYKGKIISLSDSIQKAAQFLVKANNMPWKLMMEEY